MEVSPRQPDVAQSAVVHELELCEIAVVAADPGDIANSCTERGNEGCEGGSPHQTDQLGNFRVQHHGTSPL